MTRFRHDINRRVKIYAGVTPGQEPLPEGKVRCPSCGRPVKVNPNGRITAHNDRDKFPCPHRWYGKPVELTEIPPVNLPPAPKEPAPRVYVPRAPDDPTRQVTGHCHTCDKRVPWGRLFCGQCLRKRGRV